MIAIYIGLKCWREVNALLLDFATVIGSIAVTRETMLPSTCAIEYLRFAERHYRDMLSVARARLLKS